MKEANQLFSKTLIGSSNKYSKALFLEKADPFSSSLKFPKQKINLKQIKIF